MIALIAQRAEVLRAAGNHDLRRPSCAGAPLALPDIVQQVEQGAGEDLAIAGGEFDEDLVEAVEDHDGPMVDPLVDVLHGE